MLIGSQIIQAVHNAAVKIRVLRSLNGQRFYQISDFVLIREIIGRGDLIPQTGDYHAVFRLETLSYGEKDGFFLFHLFVIQRTGNIRQTIISNRLFVRSVRRADGNRRIIKKRGITIRGRGFRVKIGQKNKQTIFFR